MQSVFFCFREYNFCLRKRLLITVVLRLAKKLSVTVRHVSADKPQQQLFRYQRMRIWSM